MPTFLYFPNTKPFTNNYLSGHLHFLGVLGAVGPVADVLQLAVVAVVEDGGPGEDAEVEVGPPRVRREARHLRGLQQEHVLLHLKEKEGLHSLISRL